MLLMHDTQDTFIRQNTVHNYLKNICLMDLN